MADFKVEIKGLKELKDALLQLPREIQGKVLADAVRPAAFMVRDAARANAAKNRKTGLMEKAIVAYRNRSSTPDRIQYDVGVTLKIKQIGGKIGAGKKIRELRESTGGKAVSAFYWRFLEFGTKKMAAKPFLRPAWEGLKNAAAYQIKDSLANAIERAANKLRR